MDLKYAPFEFRTHSFLVDRNRESDSGAVASELAMPVLRSKLPERNLPTSFRVNFHGIVSRTTQFDLFLIHVRKVNCKNNFGRRHSKIVQRLDAGSSGIPP